MRPYYMVVVCIVLVIIATNDPSNTSKSAYFVMIIPDTGYRIQPGYRISSLVNQESRIVNCQLGWRADVQT